ncbi:MAG: ABC transporter substrate-binding protein, partial [Bdellovibrionales bacterium]|nr:ABC transporter substrate-binding protein [Bdellovibrionales bacterium]
MTRKILFILILVFVPLESFAEKIKVGVLSSLTGGYAVYGEPLAKGVEIASDENFEIIIEDIGTLNGRGAVSTAKKLIEIDKIDVGIVFAIDDAEVLAPIFNSKKIPMLIAWDSNYLVEEMGEYAFSAGLDTFIGGETLANYLANKIGAKKIAIIGQESAYNNINREGFLSRAKELNLSIVLNEFFQMGENDFRPTLLKLKNSKADALLFLPILPDALYLGLKQMKELKINIPLITNELLVTDKETLKSNNVTNGCGLWIPDANSEEIVKKYEQITGSKVWNHGPLVIGYQAMEHLKSASKLNPQNIY